MDSVSVEALRAYLECPVCLEVPRRPPILQCGRGHLICPECASLLSECPMCRCSLANPTRLLLAERLLEERIPVPCKYEELGCTVQMIGVEIKKHEAICPMAPKPCPNSVRGCLQRLPSMELEKHLSKCSYRLLTCPLSSKCLVTSAMPVAELERHLRTFHLGQQDLWQRAKRIGAVTMILLSLGLNIWLLWQEGDEQGRQGRRVEL